MHKRAVLYDMDGVLIDSEWLMAATEQEVCRNHKLDVPVSEWLGFKGKTNHVIFAYILKKYGKGRGDLSVDALSAEKRELYLARASQELRPVPDALEFLEISRVCYDRLGLTTSNSKQVTAHMFDIFDLHGVFDVVVTGEHIPPDKTKPHPEPYRLTLERLGIEPGQALVIEDSDNGIKSAAAAGCTVVGITTSFPSDVLERAGAHHIVSSFQELAWMLR